MHVVIHIVFGNCNFYLGHAFKFCCLKLTKYKGFFLQNGLHYHLEYQKAQRIEKAKNTLRQHNKKTINEKKNNFLDKPYENYLWSNKGEGWWSFLLCWRFYFSFICLVLQVIFPNFETIYIEIHWPLYHYATYNNTNNIT